MKNETTKSYILTILIILSLIQLGILWNFQNHGLPINFLMSFFRGNSIEDSASYEKAAIEELFVPYRMVISNGWESHWVVGSKDKNFDLLWEDAKYHLEEVLTSKKYQEIIPLERWGECIAKRGYRLEFKTTIQNSLVRYLLDLGSDNSDESPGLHKMMIVPGDYVGLNSTTVYIMDDKGIYRYTTNSNREGLKNSDFEKIVTKLEQSNDINQEYKVFAELVNTERFNYPISPDVLFTYSSTYKSYRNIILNIPDKIGKSEQDKLNNLDVLAKIILGNEKDSFDHSIDNNSTILFRNLDSIYRIYDDGFFEFRYIPGTQGLDKGSLSSAFISASRFIKRVLGLGNSDARLYLSGISEKQDYYVFTFDYIMEDIPVTLGENFRIRDNYWQQHAVEMEVSGNRVLGCRWILMSFDESREENSYNMNTIDLLQKSRLKLGEASIRDMYTSYVINDRINKNRVNTIQPQWVIEDKDGNVHTVQMIKREKGS